MWLPIESAPKDGTRIIGYSEEMGVDFIHWQDYGEKYPDAPVGWRDGFIRIYASDASDHPTHWQPFPEPPH